jgi:hypothetical protein
MFVSFDEQGGLQLYIRPVLQPASLRAPMKSADSCLIRTARSLVSDKFSGFVSPGPTWFVITLECQRNLDVTFYTVMLSGVEHYLAGAGRTLSYPF